MPFNHLVLQTVKNPLQCRRHRFNPWVGRSPGEANDNALQYSCLEKPTDREACWAVGGKGSDMTELTSVIAYFPKMTFLNIWTNKKAKNVFFKHIFLDLLKLRCLNVK